MERGPERIAELIEEIRARFDLRRAARASDEFLGQTAVPSALIGHNRPPEPIDHLTITPDEFAQVAAAVRRISDEAEREKPDAAVLSAEAGKVETFVWRVAEWFGGKLDKSAEEFFKTLGKTGAVAVATALGAFFLELLGYLRPLLKAVAKYLPFIGA